MTSQVVFKMDSKLKERAMKKARREGLPFSVVLNRFAKSYVEGDYYLELIPREFNEKTRRELAEDLRDIDEGKDLSPVFDNAEDAIAYLDSLKCEDAPHLQEDIQQKIRKTSTKRSRTLQGAS